MTSGRAEAASGGTEVAPRPRSAVSTTGRFGVGLLVVAGFAGPLVLFFSLPPFHTGLWSQSEPVTAALHGVGAVAALGLALILIAGSRIATAALLHPFTLLPLALAAWSLALLPAVRIPLLSWFGTPEFGQGIAWYLDLSLLVAAGLVVLRLPRLRRLLAWSCVLAMTLVASTMVHTERGWWLAPFLFYDSLAFYGLFGVPLLLALFAPRHWLWRLAIVAFGVAVIGISENRTAIALSGLAVPIVGFGWWLNQTPPGSLRPLAIVGAALAPLATTAAVYLVGDSLQGGSLWSRMLHLEVARLSILHQPAALIVGGGWGSYGEWQLAHLPIGQFDLIGQAGDTSNWDAVRGELHFQSHNFLVEALLSGGIVAMVLTWLSVIALPVYCRQHQLLIAGTLAIVGGSMMSVWAPDAGMVPYIALTLAALARPWRMRRLASAVMLPVAAGLFILTAAQAATAFAIVSVGQAMYRAAHENRDTRGLAPVARDDCRDFLGDLGRGGVHVASLYRNFSLELAKKRATGALMTDQDAARLADYACHVDRTVADSASLRLANADLMVTADLLAVLNDPKLAAVTQDRVDQWRERLQWFLERAPTRSDVAVPFLSWHFANGREDDVAEVSALLLARDRNDPIGLWFSGAVMMGNSDVAADGFARMRQALDLGLEQVMPVDQAIVDKIRSAPPAD